MTCAVLPAYNHISMGSYLQPRSAVAAGSMLFSLEIEPLDENALLREQDSRITAAGMERLATLFRPQSHWEQELLRDVRQKKRALQAEDPDGPCDVVMLAARLSEIGYSVMVRCALGGSHLTSTAAPGSCFRHLRHEFLFVRCETGECKDQEYLVDPHFRDQFAVAQPTSAFSTLLASVPCVFVGRAQQLIPVVDFLCNEIAKSLDARDLTLPPWRRRDAMLSKWLPAKARDTSPGNVTPSGGSPTNGFPTPGLLAPAGPFARTSERNMQGPAAAGPFARSSERGPPGPAARDPFARTSEYNAQGPTVRDPFARVSERPPPVIHSCLPIRTNSENMDTTEVPGLFARTSRVNSFSIDRGAQGSGQVWAQDDTGGGAVATPAAGASAAHRGVDVQAWVPAQLADAALQLETLARQGQLQASPTRQVWPFLHQQPSGSHPPLQGPAPRPSCPSPAPALPCLPELQVVNPGLEWSPTRGSSARGDVIARSAKRTQPMLSKADVVLPKADVVLPKAVVTVFKADVAMCKGNMALRTATNDALLFGPEGVGGRPATPFIALPLGLIVCPALAQLPYALLGTAGEEMPPLAQALDLAGPAPAGPQGGLGRVARGPRISDTSGSRHGAHSPRGASPTGPLSGPAFARQSEPAMQSSAFYTIEPCPRLGRNTSLLSQQLASSPPDSPPFNGMTAMMPPPCTLGWAPSTEEPVIHKVKLLHRP